MNYCLAKFTKNSLVHKNKYFWIAIFWTLTIAFLCLENSSDFPKIGINNLDKVAHFSFHFLFTILWFLSFRNQETKNNVKLAITKAFCLSVTYGIFIEIAQKLFTLTRKADFFDVLANSFGAFCALILVFVINKKIKDESL
jgi:VanZ family protein